MCGRNRPQLSQAVGVFNASKRVSKAGVLAPIDRKGVRLSVHFSVPSIATTRKSASAGGWAGAAADAGAAVTAAVAATGRAPGAVGERRGVEAPEADAAAAACFRDAVTPGIGRYGDGRAASPSPVVEPGGNDGSARDFDNPTPTSRPQGVQIA